MSWLLENKEWLFSGIGGAILLGLLTWIYRSLRTETNTSSTDLASVNINQTDCPGTNIQIQQAGRDIITKNEAPASPPSPKIEDKWVSDLDYIEDAGIAERLCQQGYHLHWTGVDKEARRVDIDGWDVVIDTDKSGQKVRYKIKDDSVGGYLILLKKKEPQEQASKTTKQPSRLERLEQQMPELFAEMRQDLSESPFIREFITMRKGWLYNSDPNNPIFSYNFDDHENLTGKLTVLENHGLVTEITYNNAKRYTMSEEFVAYLTAQSQR